MSNNSSIHFDRNLITTLKDTNRITILTGAGVSQESGIPTFREAQTGLWSRFDPLELASSQAFQKNPKLVWEWYRWRQDLISRAKPNPAHYAIVQIEKSVPQLTLVTQNVDGLHQIAGSQFIIELHGNIYRTKCFTENIIIETGQNTGEVPPRCPNCGGYLRPDVVWFGELLDPVNLAKARRSAKNCEVMFSIGTSSLVEPAASLPLIALESGAILIEVNTQSTPLSKYANYVFRNMAGIILPELVSQVWEEGDLL